MGELYFGKRKIEGEEVQAYFDSMIRIIDDAGIVKGDVLVCASKLQYGTYVQWNVCRKRGIIPLFVAPDYDVEHSKIREYTDAEYVMRVSEKMEFTLEKFTKGTGRHIEIDNAAVIHMTSATTGNPKLILRTKENLDLEMNRYCKAAGITKDDIMMSIAPYFHCYAFVGPLLACEYTGASLVFPDIIMPRNIISLCESMKITYLYGVPYFFRKMVDVDAKYVLGKQMKTVVSSGEKLEKNVWQMFLDRFGIELTQQYGSTETGTITICQKGDPPECQGAPIEGNDISFKEENNKNVMVVNTHGTMGYYIGEETELIANDFYETNDVGYFDDEGRLFIDGRKDDIIIRAGEKINLKIIGKIISENELIQKAEVVLDTNSELKELVCFYSLVDDSMEIDEDKLLDFCKKRLSQYQVPRKFIKKRLKLKNNWKHQEK